VGEGPYRVIAFFTGHMVVEVTTVDGQRTENAMFMPPSPDGTHAMCVAVASALNACWRASHR
jgi:hypothetical protein